MKFISIILPLLLVSLAASAQQNTFVSSGAEVISYHAGYSTTASSLKELKTALTPLRKSHRRDGITLSSYIGINGGFDHMSVTSNNTRYSGGGPAIDVRYGFALKSGSGGQDEEFSRALSIQLNYAYSGASVSIKDSAGNSRAPEFSCSYVGLPIMYMGIIPTDRRVGFFYQGGIAPEYILRAQIAGADPTGHFNKVVVIPSVGAGITFVRSVQTSMLRKRTSVIQEQDFIGLYASYSVNNSFNDGNVGIRTLTIGIHLSKMLLY